MQQYENQELIIDSNNTQSGTISWQCPSNIAIIKYWGKYGRQLPRNPSISFTLDNARTSTSLEYKLRTSDAVGIQLNFFFEGENNPAFQTKVEKFLTSILDIFPFLNQLDLTIKSSNSFPHSAGIASSASAMGALALCLCSVEQNLFGTLQDEAEFHKKASYVARLGSGSACRSLYPVMGIWGERESANNSSNLFAIPWEQKVHAVFHSFHDDIMIVSKAEKSVSSRAGHGLMENNIYADLRYQQAKDRFDSLLVALQDGDLATFGKIAEDEALTLHALMMASEPSYILMRPNTITMIEKIRTFRNKTGLQVFFSLDAGPNIHLLYPDEIKVAVKEFIQKELVPLCEDGTVIEDQVGSGPKKISVL